MATQERNYEVLPKQMTDKLDAGKYWMNPGRTCTSSVQVAAVMFLEDWMDLMSDGGFLKYGYPK